MIHMDGERQLQIGDRGRIEQLYSSRAWRDYRGIEPGLREGKMGRFAIIDSPPPFLLSWGATPTPPNE